MFSLFTSALAGLGKLFANVGSNACFGLYLDEAECPKSLLK